MLYIVAMKTCITCNALLPIEQYYKHPQMADGHLNKCKDCVKAYQKKRPSSKEYERTRAMLPHRVAQRERYAKTERGKAAIMRAHKASKERFPTRYKARNKVSNALRDRKIFRPNQCSECDKKCKPHGHHDDYAKPLAVRWLCTTCHRKWHVENGPGLNG